MDRSLKKKYWADQAKKSVLLIPAPVSYTHLDVYKRQFFIKEMLYRIFLYNEFD